MRVLAFDASTTTGWAAFASARDKPVVGEFELVASTNYGAMGLSMQHHVLALVAEHRPEIVGFEAPIFLPRDRWHTRRLLNCLVVVIELVATIKGLRCIEVEPSVVKKVLGGKGADKDQQQRAARLLGFPVTSHHQADACGVALGVYGHLQSQRFLQGAR